MTASSLFFARPPPSLPPLGGGVKPTASVPSPHGGGLGWGLGKLEDLGVEEVE